MDNLTRLKKAQWNNKWNCATELYTTRVKDTHEKNNDSFSPYVGITAKC